jgi:uncharacterized membrane protein
MSTDGVAATGAAASREPIAFGARVLAWCSARRHALVVWGAMAVWTAALYAKARADYLDFRYGRWDFGRMVQPVWSTAHGRPLEVTSDVGEQVSRLSVHIDPILVLFTPFWLVAASPLTIVLVRIVAVSLGALPVFWLARRHLGSERLAVLLALVYLTYPWVAWTALAPHAVTLAIPLLLYAIWYLDGGRLWAFVPFGVLVPLTNEIMGVTLAALGVWYAFARGRRRVGLTIAAASLAWVFVAVYVLVPAFTSGASSVYYGYFDAVGGSPQGVVRTAFTHPGVLLSALFTSRDLVYLVALAIPLGGFFLLAPALAAVALPQLLVNTLATPTAMTDPTAHYTCAVIPILMAATVFGIARLSEHRRAFAVKLALASSLAVSVVVGVWPGTPGKATPWDAVSFSAAHRAAIRSALALVPPDAAVSSTTKVGSHLSARRYYYDVPVLGRASWIVLDRQDPFVHDPKFPALTRSSPGLQRFERRIERDPHWLRVYDQDDVLVFRRVSA